MKNPRSLKKGKESWKVENFTLHLEALNRWRVSGRDLNGNYRRMKFQAETKTEAIRTAKEILRFPVENCSDDFPVLHISDALIRSSEGRNWTLANRANDALNCDLFLRWIDRQGLRYWHELRFEHVTAYQRYLRDRNLAYDTIRLYLWPIRRAAVWVVSNYPHHYINICEGLRLTSRDVGSSTYREDEGNPTLSVAELLDFLDSLARHPIWDRLTASVALQGLAGLRLQESLRLTWEKVNFEMGTVVIDGVVKNKFSVRCLPVPTVVLWLLRRAYHAVESPTPHALVTPFYSDYRHYSQAVKKALRIWNPAIRIEPKDLRNTLPTAAFDGGWHSVYVERYLGHSPKSITERHYHGDQGKRLLPLFREKVVSPNEAEIDVWKVGRESPIIPGPRRVDLAAV